MQELIITFISLVAGFVQGVSGFGSAIVMMMVFPMYFTVIQGAGISNAINIFLNGMMAYRYRNKVDFRKVVFPSILFLISSTISTYLGMNVDQVLIKKIFGFFLILLSIYFMFFSSNQKRNLSLFVSLICIIVSGICNGLFGIGGPLMVIYFLSQIDDKEQYLGTMQSFFLINNIMITGLRFTSGIISIIHLPFILCGTLGVFVGVSIANKVVDRVDSAFIRKITYFMLGISGILNII